MGFVQLRVSDLSGQVLAEEDIVTVVVKAAGKVIDASREELAALKAVSNVIELEYRYADGKTEEVLVSKASFDQVVSAEVLAAASSNRGRRVGYKPSQNGA